MSIPTGTCPVCSGSGRAPTLGFQAYVFAAGGRPDSEATTSPCRNCGGQTMSGHATGQVPLRPDGTPCEHSYREQLAGRSYYKYDCAHCGHHYSIDCGD